MDDRRMLHDLCLIFATICSITKHIDVSSVGIKFTTQGVFLDIAVERIDKESDFSESQR